MCSISVDPIPSSTSTPKRRSVSWYIRAGSASPAETPNRTVAKASSGTSAPASSGPKKLGVPNRTVARSPAARLANSAGDGLEGSSSAVPPDASGKNSELPMPYAKNSFATDRQRSSGPMPSTRCP